MVTAATLAYDIILIPTVSSFISGLKFNCGLCFPTLTKAKLRNTLMQRLRLYLK